jgi:hypothetical protein
MEGKSVKKSDKRRNSEVTMGIKLHHNFRTHKQHSYRTQNGSFGGASPI